MATYEWSFEEKMRFAQMPNSEYGRLLCEQQKVDNSSIFGCILGPDGRGDDNGVVAAGTSRGHVYAWDVATKVQISPAPCDVRQTCKNPKPWDAKVGGIYAMALIPGQTKPVLAVGGDRGVCLAAWEPESWPAPRVHQSPIDDNPDGSRPPPPECNALAVHDARLVCGDGDGAVRRRDVETGKIVETCKAHADMVLALSLAEEAGVVATASEDGDACLVDFRQKDAVVKRFSGVAATARTAAAAAGVAEGQGWCGAVHADPRANWVTIAGGVDGPTESIGGGRESLGGWLATFYAPTGNLSRCFATKAPIRVLQPDATRGLLLAGGDNADLLTLPLHDCSSTAAPRRIRVPSPAIYSIAVGDAPGRLLRANQLDGDDSGAPPVVLTAGPAPFVSVSAGDQYLHHLKLLQGEPL